MPRVELPSEMQSGAEVSALTGAGIPELRGRVAGMLAGRTENQGKTSIFTAAQEDLLRQALAALEKDDTAGCLRLLEVLLSGRQ